MSEIEKDLSISKQNGDAEPQNRQFLPSQELQEKLKPEQLDLIRSQPKPGPASEPEDDNVSWEDAFKETEAANAAGKSAAANQDVINDLDLNNIENVTDKPDSDSDSDIEIKNTGRDSAAGGELVKTPAKKSVKKLEFASFDESDKTTEPPKNLDFILDIPLTISVELGRTKMVINDMLQLGQGSVIELVKLAGEPLDIYVNGKLMAKGEVVLVNDKFGVRLTDIISPVERVKKL